MSANNATSCMQYRQDVLKIVQPANTIAFLTVIWRSGQPAWLIINCSTGNGIVEGRGVRKLIAKLNIEHFRRLLASESDEAKRATLTQLLNEEEGKLRRLETEPQPSDPDD